MDTIFMEVLSQIGQADLVRFLPWFLSAAVKSGADFTCSVSDTFTSITTSELKGITALASTSSPAHRVSTPPPFLPASDILAASTPVGQPLFTLNLGLKCKKWDHSPSRTLEGQRSKRDHTGTEEGIISSGCSTPPIQFPAGWVELHSSKQPELINLPSSPVKAAADPNDRLVLKALGSTIDHDRDSVVKVSGDDADQSGDRPDSSSTDRKVLLTLVPSQQLGTASHVQIPRRRPSTLPTRSFRRKFRPSGRRPSWNGLVIVTKLYGRLTMKSSKQIGS